MPRSLLPMQSAAVGTGLQWLSSALDLAALVSPSSLVVTDPGGLFWTGPPRLATSMPGGDARAVGIARDFTVATLRRWNIAERVDDISTVVSELVTNALRHAAPSEPETWSRWPVRLGLLQPGASVLCLVADPSEDPPVKQSDEEWLAEGGRGLLIVEALSEDWGYSTVQAIGKVVWAKFSLKN